MEEMPATNSSTDLESALAPSFPSRATKKVSAKIASSIDAAMMAHFLAMQNKGYDAYSGILKEETGETISCVGYIGKIGMRETDREIVKMMLDEK